MSKKSVHSVEEFAEMISTILHSDRGVNLACSGETGEGKSTFLIQLQKAYCKVAGIEWSYDRLTWDRDELRVFIDGDGEEKKGQLPEYSNVLADEMINMFFSQEWHDPEQQDMIKVLNQCRDRHLFFGGNNPSFFDLNPKVRERFSFFAFVFERGKAWIFVPEKNPFTKDKWNANDNIKSFRKFKHPYNSHNYAFEVHYDDLDDVEKAEYLAIRNTKRVDSMDKTREKREFKNATKRDYVLGLACVKLMELTGKSALDLSKNHLKISNQTFGKYVNIGRSVINDK